MDDLFHLAVGSKKIDEESLVKIIYLFGPKIKQVSRSMPLEDREDLEQELKMQIAKALIYFEFDNTPNFHDFISKKDNK